MKTYFKVFPKRKPSPGGLNSSEVCVHCRTGFVDFADIFGNGTVLGCYVCGGLFLSSDCREHEKLYKGEQLAEQEKGFVEGRKVVDKIEVIEGIKDCEPPPPYDEAFTTKCGKQMETAKKVKQHEAVCKKCNA